MKRYSLRCLIIFMFLSFVLSAMYPANTLAADKYVFERMWPVLEQPWYFNYPSDVAIDSQGNVYVADTSNDFIQKFSSSGEFITKWVSSSPEGIAIDSQGNLYVVDSEYSRIQKFSSSGEFISGWGSYGAGDAQFFRPKGIATDSQGNVYVADTFNDRIQKFSSSGQFISKWGSEGTGDGQFENPSGIATDSQGNIYVADTYNSRIQKFSSSGEFITKWGSEGDGDGEFSSPEGIAIDTQGNVYVADTQNVRIQKFSSSGEFLSKWKSSNCPYGIDIDTQGNVYVCDYNIEKFSSSGKFISKWGGVGDGDGEFDSPEGIAIDTQGNVYVADEDRIQKFSSSGEFITKWRSRYRCPEGIAIDTQGNVYVTNSCDSVIEKFSSSGEFITKWGSEDIWRSGDGDGEFNWPTGIAIDTQGNVYVADSRNYRIQKFSSSGEFITKWGSEGNGNGQFSWPGPTGIAIDLQGNVYVAGNSRIQKFSSSGEFIGKWGSSGDGDGEFNGPEGIAIDTQGNVYVVDRYNERIQKFSPNGQFITKFCGFGFDPGLVNSPYGVAVSDDGKIYVSDTDNNRIQVFKEKTTDVNRKAIIVAGSGPYETNTEWDGIQMCANYAYRALMYQGYNKESIYYLSADTDLVDNDGQPVVDADATNVNLGYAITTWAFDADNLFIYLVGHGGECGFVTSEFEILEPTQLDGWLDLAQQTITDFVALVYDACHSGSFIPYLLPPSGKTRVVATSTAPNEKALFMVQGGLSFGYQFFSYLYNGKSFYKSFDFARKIVQGTDEKDQTPQVEGDGDGIGNEKEDKEIAETLKIGNQTENLGDFPRIESVSQPENLAVGEMSAILYAYKVVDANGITEVFAVIKPPDYSDGTTEDPVTDLPIVSFTNIGNNTWSGIYNGFSKEGTYSIAIFAKDAETTLSLPYPTSVTVPEATDCLAVASGLGINVPCVEYNGSLYAFTLDFYRNPDDPSGFYWKLVMPTLTTGTGSYCIPIGSDLSIPMDCVSYNSTKYGFTLKFYPNAYDPSGLYWVMDKSTLVAK